MFVHILFWGEFQSRVKQQNCNAGPLLGLQNFTTQEYRVCFNFLKTFPASQKAEIRICSSQSIPLSFCKVSGSCNIPSPHRLPCKITPNTQLQAWSAVALTSIKLFHCARRQKLQSVHLRIKFNLCVENHLKQFISDLLNRLCCVSNILKIVNHQVCISATF